MQHFESSVFPLLLLDSQRPIKKKEAPLLCKKFTDLCPNRLKKYETTTVLERERDRKVYGIQFAGDIIESNFMYSYTI